MRRLLINNVVPVEAAAGCDFCLARRRGQESVIEEFKRRFDRDQQCFVAAAQPYEIRGSKRLREHFANWVALA
jgi:hypothetical protein